MPTDDVGHHLRDIVSDVIAGVHEYISRCLAYIQHSELKMYQDYISDRLRDIGLTNSDVVIECSYAYTMDMITVKVRCYVDDWTKPRFVDVSIVIDKTHKFEPVVFSTAGAWFCNGAK